MADDPAPPAAAAGKREKRTGASSNVWPVMHDEIERTCGFGADCGGQFLMTCSDVSGITLWSPAGDRLERIDPCLGNNYSAKVSRCGRFVAVCGKYQQGGIPLLALTAD